MQFLLTRPSRGATESLQALLGHLPISTHTPLAGRDDNERCVVNDWYISTHTPLAGRDYCTYCKKIVPISISTHTPLAGRDPIWTKRPGLRRYFYSHAPRGARLPSYIYDFLHIAFLLTRPSRGATNSRMQLPKKWLISTHTPLAGRDRGGMEKEPQIYISTHTPLAGRDYEIVEDKLKKFDFYSHAPRGARPALLPQNRMFQKFLLTRPSRGATRVLPE